MNLERLLSRLNQEGIHIHLDREDLLVSGAKEKITDEIRSSLNANKPALVKLLKFMQLGGERSSIGQAIADPERRFKPFPLTDIQQAYWIGSMEAVSYGGVSCHYYQEFESSSLELQRLEDSFQKLISEQDMLRAVVQPNGRQRILEQVPTYSFSLLDLRYCDPVLADKLICQVRERMAGKVFRADQWPLFEIHASIMNNNRMRLHLSFDLLMLDASSLSKLIHRWEFLYRTGGGGTPLPFSFRDYVLADLNFRQTSAYQNDLTYWLKRLPDIASGPELPRAGDGRANAAQLERKRFKFVVHDIAWENLKSSAAELGCTPSCFLVTAFCKVLASWSKDTRFSIVLTNSRRAPVHEDVDEILADFTSTTILSNDWSGGFTETLQSVQKQLQDDLAHAAVSGVEVLRRLNQREQTLASRVMPVVFTSLLGQGTQPEVLFSSNWLGECVYGTSQTPQVTLDHQAFEQNGALVCQWDVVTPVFPPGVIEAIFQAYKTLLHKLARDRKFWRQQDLVELPEEQRLVRRENATPAEPRYLSGLLLQDLFTRQAQKTPQAIAIVNADRTLTYDELNRRTLQLAHSLRNTITKPGEPIGVVMERGWEQIVAVLGILRAGGAYVPIAADLPDTRIQFICECCELKMALVQRNTRHKLPPDVRAVEVGAFDGHVAQNPIPSRQSNTDLAYIIFTSGSTGQPKGVMIDHRGAVNTVLDVNDRLGISGSDRVLALSSLEFDLSVYDIFGMLAAGAAVVIPKASESRDPQTWLELVNKHEVTVWNTVPALMKMFADYVDGKVERIGGSLRAIMLSGDWIPLTLPAKIRLLAPDAKIISLGGATEASIWSVMYSIGEINTAWKSIPYGTALTNQSICVLNAQLDECPDYVSGEIYIGGAGLAMGYWRNEEETKKRFITHPMSGQRLYRSGDIGRYLKDGNLEILGREDNQVKIQGHRIELGEIESALNRQQWVSQCVVVAHGTKGGNHYLAAYVVPVGDGQNGLGGNAGQDTYLKNLEERLRQYLKEQLPHYMIPQKLVFMENLPVTVNGKVDRARLAHINQDSATANDLPQKTPSNEIERVLAAIIGKVLGREKIFLNDNFADLCCTSLEIVEIHRELRSTIGDGVPISELFNHANVESLCRYLEDFTKGRACMVQEQSNRYDPKKVREYRQVLMQRRRQSE